MVLESLAAAGLVGNIIQFIDFSSKILSKTQQVYQSGLLAENIDIELVTNHLIKLSKELQTSANSSNSDPTLEKLCESCNDVANELLEALGELKVNGRNGIWRSVRKALKSVLSKEKIESIQMRLTGFRDELSLHIVVGIRGQIDLLSLQQSNHLELLDESSKALIDTFLNSHDAFRHEFVVQTEELARMQERTDIAAREVQEQTNMTVRQEHATTRLRTVEEVQLANARNLIEHEITRQEIAQVKRAIDQLREEMKQRNSEWKALLLELTNPESSRRKEELRKRRNAVSVMLMALEAVHRILLEVLASLQSHANKVLALLRINQLWRAPTYPASTLHPTPETHPVTRTNDMLLCYIYTRV